MRIFITGASGFLGSKVVSQLKGHELLCFSRSPEKIAVAPRIHVVKGDLKNPTEWQTEVEQFAPQWCIHLAWEGLPDYSLAACRTNLNASIALLEVLARVGIKRVVVAGSCWEYGTLSGAVKEDQLVRERGVFASAKHSFQMMLESVARKYSFEYCWARVFFSYGPGQRNTSLIAQCHAAYSRGVMPEIRFPNAAQDFIYVDDVAQALISLIQADVPSGIFNIGSGKLTSVGYVANCIANHFDMPPSFLLQEKNLNSGFWADTSKIRSATGWTAQTEIDEGIKKTLRDLELQ